MLLHRSEKKTLVRDEKETERIQEEVMEKFFRLFQCKVIDNHDAYLLTEMVLDIKKMSEEHELAEPPILKMFTRRKRLTEWYGDAVTFGKIGNRIVVHSSDVSSLAYLVATMQGHGLREEDLTEVFSRFVRCKIFQRQSIKWLLDAYELCRLLDSYRPLQCIYNAIAWLINQRKSVDANGYVKATKVEAEKLSAISPSWEKAVTRERLPMGTALSLTLH